MAPYGLDYSGRSNEYIEDMEAAIVALAFAIYFGLSDVASAIKYTKVERFGDED